MCAYEGNSNGQMVFEEHMVSSRQGVWLLHSREGGGVMSSRVSFQCVFVFVFVILFLRKGCHKRVSLPHTLPPSNSAASAVVAELTTRE